MNQIAPPRSRVKPSKNGHSRPTVSPDIEAQARLLDGIFKAIGRKVLVDDDPASELPLRQFRVCAALLEGPRSMKDLSLELGVSQSAVTQLADRLETAGMVTRVAAGDDRRVRSLQLTPRAENLLRRREESRIGRVASILERMAPADRAAVLSSLAALRDAALENPRAS
jgi:DNA-binding MarR family transcriptional regulator